MSNLVRLANWMSNIEIRPFRVVRTGLAPPVYGNWRREGGCGSRREGGGYDGGGSHCNFSGNWRMTSNSVLSYQVLMALFSLAR
jgi:hypothetical protein